MPNFATTAAPLHGRHAAARNGTSTGFSSVPKRSSIVTLSAMKEPPNANVVYKESSIISVNAMIASTVAVGDMLQGATFAKNAATISRSSFWSAANVSFAPVFAAE